VFVDLDLFDVFFIYCMLYCVLIDLVPVSTEQPVGVDQEQLFEEEENLFVGEEGK
jgi:hypothetical protein